MRPGLSKRPHWIPPALGILIAALAVAAGAGEPAQAPLGDAVPAMPPRAVPAFRLGDALETAGQMPRLHSLLVSWRGEVILERYYNGMRPTRLANMKSASKSVISALVGIAIDRGAIEGIDQPIVDFFPEYLGGESNAAKRAITIENLLTMQAGLETTSNRNYGAWVLSGNWVRFALRQPLQYPPATRMVYSTGNTHLLSSILTRATGTSTWQFADEMLAQPLGFRMARWPRDPQGVYFGGNDMQMTPRQMLAFGQLYIDGGRAKGRQIVPASWVQASLVPRTPSPREIGRYYGYGWWIRSMAGHSVPYAWGYGGQFIFLVPDLELVVVLTSVSTPGSERRGHLRRIYRLAEDDIVRPVAEALGAAGIGPRQGN